jgi:response regulator RpfG family c-di-GMP phosphodiesterase
MLDKRPYKEPYTHNRIVKELKRNSGKMYDPKVVDAFLVIIEEKEDGGFLQGSNTFGV